ncbi:MAG: lipid droplet assembly factor 1 [Bryobacteraceae bacterium]|nr:lipid droplet assembly factor 1 [Bryobacteraceae bacterium]MDW8377278.1 hypothetical protein [Bryobacterales bacterium]
MKKIPAIISGFVLAVGLLSLVPVSFGTPEYTKKEKKGCAVCHVTAKSKELNDVGKCYEAKKDMKACSK